MKGGGTPGSQRHSGSVIIKSLYFKYGFCSKAKDKNDRHVSATKPSSGSYVDDVRFNRHYIGTSCVNNQMSIGNNHSERPIHFNTVESTCHTIESQVEKGCHFKTL